MHACWWTIKRNAHNSHTAVKQTKLGRERVCLVGGGMTVRRGQEVAGVNILTLSCCQVAVMHGGTVAAAGTRGQQ